MVAKITSYSYTLPVCYSNDLKLRRTISPWQQSLKHQIANWICVIEWDQISKINALMVTVVVHFIFYIIDITVGRK